MLFFRHLDSQIHTFSQNTLDCLETCLTRLQEEAIPEFNSHLIILFNQDNKLRH
jgi:hypothetical protein